MSRPLETDLRRTAWRIGLQTGLLLIACLLLVGAIVYVTVVRNQDKQLNQSLTTAVAQARLGDDADGDDDHRPTQPNSGVYVSVLHRGALTSSARLPAGLPDLDAMEQVVRDGREDQRTIAVASGRYRVLTVKRGDAVVQAMASLFQQHQERERILSALGLAGGVGLVLATLLATLLARQAVRPMAEALELQRRFVADAGHELRTPLTLLNTRAQLLSRRVHAAASAGTQNAKDELVIRDADGIVADTRALTDVLEELLLAADTRTPLPREPVDLGAIVEAAASSAQATADAAGISLSVRVLDRAVLAAGAPTALSRSVTALLDNALDHARSQVTVDVRPTGRQVVVEVTDDGPGIPAEVLPRMFARFSSDRPDDVAEGPRRHYGLGLALVSEVASRHGGSVTAQNRPSPETGAVLRLELLSD